MPRFTLSRAAPFLAVFLLLGSTGAGIVFMVLSALDLLPGVASGISPGGIASGGIWRLFNDPRIGGAIAATCVPGFLGTVASLVLSLALAATWNPGGRDGRPWPPRIMVAALAVPHAALALGLAFLLAPSGWLVRVAASLSGLLPLPPDIALVQDRYGLALAVALVLKETPFLYLAIITALAQLRPEASVRVALTMGYGPGMAWVKVVLPQLYPLIRFPVLAVLTYSFSVVDMSLVLGPTTPPTLPVLVLRLANDPDIAQRGMASAAALLQLALVCGAMLAWRCAEGVAGRFARGWHAGGQRRWPGFVARAGGWFMLSAALVLGLLLSGSILSLALWSVADTWRFPDLLPSGFTLAAWRGAAASGGPVATSLVLAFLSASVALTLAIACLGSERRAEIHATGLRRAERLLFLPLLLPDICFLVGIEVLLLLAGLNGGWFAVTWLHLLFVFPYVFLSLKDPWRALDPRFERIAGALGLSPARVFLRARLPLMRGAIVWSAAIGCAVSLSLYLPTVLGGEGRITTLATEAISLASGGDRRVAGAYGMLQAAIIAAVFGIAVAARGHRRGRAP